MHESCKREGEESIHRHQGGGGSSPPALSFLRVLRLFAAKLVSEFEPGASGRVKQRGVAPGCGAKRMHLVARRYTSPIGGAVQVSRRVKGPARRGLTYLTWGICLRHPRLSSLTPIRPRIDSRTVVFHSVRPITKESGGVMSPVLMVFSWPGTRFSPLRD